MKPLELTIHPPLTPIVQAAIDWNVAHGLPPRSGLDLDMHLPGVSAMRRKRLTDAELAAEWQRTQADKANAAEFSSVPGWFSGGRVLLREDEFGWDEVVEITGSPSVDYWLTVKWEQVVERFATHPHYDESTP